MHALRGYHVVAGHRGGVAARWCWVAVATAASNNLTATIRVGANPQGVAAADPVAHSAYVPNNAHGTVSVIDDPRFNTANGTQRGIFTCNGGANQHWKLP